MDLKEINKIKKELFLVFSSFIKNPEDEKIKEKAIEIDKKYSGLLSYVEHSSKEIAPEFIINALGAVSLIYEFGLYDDSHEAFSKIKIKEIAKEILKTLEG